MKKNYSKDECLMEERIIERLLSKLETIDETSIRSIIELENRIIGYVKYSNFDKKKNIEYIFKLKELKYLFDI